jgi:hypothetical protein
VISGGYHPDIKQGCFSSDQDLSGKITNLQDVFVNKKSSSIFGGAFLSLKHFITKNF